MKKRGKAMETRVRKVVPQFVNETAEDKMRRLVVNQLGPTRKHVLAAYEALASTNATPEEQLVSCIAIAISAGRQNAMTDDQILLCFSVMLRNSRTKEN